MPRREIFGEINSIVSDLLGKNAFRATENNEVFARGSGSPAKRVSPRPVLQVSLLKSVRLALMCVWCLVREADWTQVRQGLLLA